MSRTKDISVIRGHFNGISVKDVSFSSFVVVLGL